MPPGQTKFTGWGFRRVAYLKGLGGYIRFTAERTERHQRLLPGTPQTGTCARPRALSKNSSSRESPNWTPTSVGPRHYQLIPIRLPSCTEYPCLLKGPFSSSPETSCLYTHPDPGCILQHPYLNLPSMVATQKLPALLNTGRQEVKCDSANACLWATNNPTGPMQGLRV